MPKSEQIFVEDDWQLLRPHIPPASPDEWSTFLGQLTAFNGNPDNAGALMNAFSQGGDFVIDTLTERGLSVEKPPAAVANSSSMFWLSTLTGQVAVASLGFLQEWSRGEPDSHIHTSNRQGEITFCGSVIDYYALKGVEETHHGVFRQFKEPRGKALSRDLSAAEYSADEHEYRALKWMVRYAKAKDMQRGVIDGLELILSAARQIRLSQFL